MTKMTLEQVRDWHRVVASENAERRALCSPNGERWELWNDEFNKQVAMADAIDAHLAKGAQVPDGFIVVPMPNPEEMEALRSFAATAGDDESYTVSRELMSRLLLFGAVYRSTKRDWYYLTDFGRCLLAAAPMLSQRGEVES